MEIGHVVDYCIEYNNMQEQAFKEAEGGNDGAVERPTRRKATQADWDAFWGS